MPARPLRRRRAQTVRVKHLAAPIAGIDTVTPASEMDPTHCVQLWNMTPSEYGLRSRLGSVEWVTGLTGSLDNQVRTIIPFTGSAKNGSKDKLFACTSTGIWDVSASSTTPSQVVTFPTVIGEAGYGVSLVIVTLAGGHSLLYADEENGLYRYDEATSTWTKVTQGAGAGQIANVDPATICFVTVFKSRVWLVQKDTASAWYLPAGQIAGAASQFDFANKFKNGGDLRGLWSWTGDGGVGIDDHLVGVSGGGDVVIWKGTDPSLPTPGTFLMVGVWYLGQVPYGRKFATDFGGDLLFLTRVGGRLVSDLTGGNSTPQYQTASIANLFNRLSSSTFGLKGWSARLHPEDNSLIVMVPTYDGQATEQLAMSLSTKGWGRYRDLPIYCAEPWGGKLYFGTTDGRVCINTGYVDGVTLADPNAYTAIQWALLTAFDSLGNGRQKRIQMIRPTILSDGGAPSYQAEARYKYDFSDVASVSATPVAGGWDSGLWDTAVWAGEYTAQQEATGAYGLGVDMAVAIRGTAVSRTVLVGMDVFFDQGGLL